MSDEKHWGISDVRVRIGRTKMAKSVTRGETISVHTANGAREDKMKQKFEVGDRVRVKNNKSHKACPKYYPERGTVGTIEDICDNGDLFVRWPTGSTSKDDRWYIGSHLVKKVKERK